MTASTLHKKRVDEYKAWLVAQGYEVRDPKGEFEIFQVKDSGRWRAYFQRLHNSSGGLIEHVTVPKIHNSLVVRFINERPSRSKLHRERHAYEAETPRGSGQLEELRKAPR